MLSWRSFSGAKGFSKAFQEVLDAISEAFKSVYNSLVGKELTPELRKMFDEILGKQQPTESTPNVVLEPCSIPNKTAFSTLSLLCYLVLLIRTWGIPADLLVYMPHNIRICHPLLYLLEPILIYPVPLYPWVGYKPPVLCLVS